MASMIELVASDGQRIAAYRAEPAGKLARERTLAFFRQHLG